MLCSFNLSLRNGERVLLTSHYVNCQGKSKCVCTGEHLVIHYIRTCTCSVYVCVHGLVFRSNPVWLSAIIIEKLGPRFERIRCICYVVLTFLCAMEKGFC